MKQPATGSNELIKNLNTASVLNMIRISGQISRADIARATGLTPATVSNITAEIIDLGLIKETERGESSGGRKPILLSINRKACFFGSIHISSENVEAAVSDVGADLLAHKTSPLGSSASPEDVVAIGLRLLENAMKEAGVKRLSGIGVCTHGLVRADDGILVFAPNLGWANVAIGGMIKSATGLPVAVENDVRAMALAESWCGLARGVKDYVYLYIGTGIGGSIVNDNELYKGQRGFAGEFGHMTIEPNGPLCSCGSHGCLQTLASETAILKRYAERRGILGGKEFQKIDFLSLIEAVKNGDDLALEEILKSVRYIGIEVGNIINTLSPSLIVINGHITKLSASISPVLKMEIGRHCMKDLQDNVNIAFSKLSDEAPIRGAATCIIRQLFETPTSFFETARNGTGLA